MGSVGSLIPLFTAALLLLLAGCNRPQAVKPAAQVAPSYAAKFAYITEQAGLSFRQYHGGCGKYYFVEQIAAGAALFDANGDGYLDAYFPQPQPLGKCEGKFKQPLHHRLYVNDGKGHFIFKPAAFGGVDTDYGIGASVGDYDNDGDGDLYVTCYGRNKLFRNRGNGTFEDATKQAGVGLTGMSTSSVWFDYDKDGYLDLYVARYCEWSVAMDRSCSNEQGRKDVCSPLLYTPTRDALYHNNGNGTFTEVSKQAGVAGTKRRGLGVAALDVNDDGKLDLFVANDISPNYLYINQGQGKFRDMAMQTDVAYGLAGHALANMGVAVGDYNDDSKLDLLVTVFEQQGYTLYRNNGLDFTNVSGTTGIFQATLPYLAFGTGFVDSRNNGQLDVFFANGHVSPSSKFQDPRTAYKQRNQLMLNNGKGSFVDTPAALPKDDVRVHRGAAFGDIDNDGRVDILVTASDDQPTLLHNQSQAGNWLLLKLINKQGCVTPVGARCIATIQGKKRLRVVLGGGSYAGESDHRVHFGLGSADKVERLEIQWLSGRKQVLENVSANQILTVKEGK
ncbi:MAG TPA: CRTAC1 family protein [Abditibacteriaceae bacterium]|jgi:hypothetical protein